MNITKYLEEALIFDHNEYLTKIVDDGKEVTSKQLKDYFKCKIPMSIWLTADWNQLCYHVNRWIEESKE